MKTYSLSAKEITRKWYILDAKGKVLGRLATEIARVLRGKHKPIYTPHLDTGDFVIVINADKVKLTGRKLIQKYHQRYSGYPGGLKETRYDKLFIKHPTLPLELAVKRMLPKGKLGRKMFKKLKAYAGEGPKHAHKAQNPEPFPYKIS